MRIAHEVLDDIREHIGIAESEYSRLRLELSTVDKTISDILHELEFVDSLSASQGYKYARMLKNLREDRRYIKNELEELNTFLLKVNEFDLYKLKKCLINLENKQNNRTYTPRVLTEEKRQIMLNVI